ncbi:MAG TPA: MBL fold metallo-hydrolase [Flavobacteriales bacterium]|nr:MBL fold metallo-hydrolase [Flavobacteriales bacterium]
MNLHVIDTGSFKLDGGAMFGVVPKTIWQRTNPADANNMCTWKMRLLLIENGKQLMLVDAGMGDKQDEKFFSHYYLGNTKTVEQALNEKGFSIDEVTDVFLTHLHFDHCGGAINRKKSGEGYEPAFKNATYWSSERHWKWATQPNVREKASFLKENILPIEQSGQLKFIDRIADFVENAFENIDVLFVDGHTDSMMIPHIKYDDKTIVYMADLIPSVGHIPVPYVMGYDTRPLITIDEKGKFLNRATDENFILFFEHDSVNECCTLQHTEKGVRLGETLKLEDIL